MGNYKRIIDEIYTAIQTLNIPLAAFDELPYQLALEVERKALETFVKDSPRVWWLSLKHPYNAAHFPNGSGYLHVLEHIPADQKRCWFIPETGDRELPVFDVEVQYIPQVIGECFGFEYNAVGHNYDWLIIETDHSEVIVSRVPT